MALQDNDRDWADQMSSHLQQGMGHAHRALTTSPDQGVRDLAASIIHAHTDHLSQLVALGAGSLPQNQNSNSSGAGRKVPRADPEDATPENAAFMTGL